MVRKTVKVSQLISSSSVNFSLDFSTLCPDFVPVSLKIKRLVFNDVNNNKTFFMCSNLEDDTKTGIMYVMYPMTTQMYFNLDDIYTIQTMSPNFVVSVYNGSTYQQYPANYGTLNSCLFMELEFINDNI